MLEKIKKWNWPLIWATLTPFGISLVWYLLWQILVRMATTGDLGAVHLAGQMTPEVLYGFCFGLIVPCFINTIRYLWKFAHKLVPLLFPELRRK